VSNKKHYFPFFCGGKMGRGVGYFFGMLMFFIVQCASKSDSIHTCEEIGETNAKSICVPVTNISLSFCIGHGWVNGSEGNSVCYQENGTNWDEQACFIYTYESVLGASCQERAAKFWCTMGYPSCTNNKATIVTYAECYDAMICGRSIYDASKECDYLRQQGYVQGTQNRFSNIFGFVILSFLGLVGLITPICIIGMALKRRCSQCHMEQKKGDVELASL
jgi:hypothetical protein